MNYQSWSISKYKPLKRPSELSITTDVTLALDSNSKSLMVYSNGNQIERVHYPITVESYPLLKVNENYLYILYNPIGQGFRLTFCRSEDRLVFVKSMQKLTYISQSPAKLYPLSQEVISGISSKSPSARSLSQPSYPVRNPYTSTSKYPFGDERSSFGESSYNPYSSSPYDIDNKSIQSSYSPYSHSSFSSQQSYLSGLDDFASSSSNIFSQSSQQDSQLSNSSIDPFTPPQPIQKIDVGCQTEEIDVFHLKEDEFEKFVERLMSDKKFIEGVKKFRKKIRKLSKEKKRRLNEETSPDNNSKTFLDLDNQPGPSTNSDTIPSSSSIDIIKPVKRRSTRKKPKFQHFLDDIKSFSQK